MLNEMLNTMGHPLGQSAYGGKSRFPSGKTKLFFIFLTCILITCNLKPSFSNNIQVNNATLTGQQPSGNYTLVQFDLSWDNSWRDAVNWDAAWVFVKYKASYDTTWKHATLASSYYYHTIPNGFTGSQNDPAGLFIYRSSNGNGNVSLTDVKLRWEYGLNGVNDGDLVQVKVFAIEMVYIPQGSFYAGDGTLANVTGQFSQGNTTSPYLITGEGALTLGGAPLTNLGNRNASGMLTADDFNNTTTQTLPASFPKGFNAIYCMKYEISQGQYTEFLNTLTRAQQFRRVETNISTDVITNIYVMSNTPTNSIRNVIICPGSGNGTTQPINFTCSRNDRACNLIGWTDGCAYMDWAGLRPMTELEYEKICRGPITPVADEFAWGTILFVGGTTLGGSENGTETITTANANANNWGFFSGGDGGLGPLRCGIFAKVSTTRAQSGATYYGVMEMSSNLQERTVSTGSITGRLFDGLNGNGTLSVLGNANVTNWPDVNGSGMRGRVTGTGARTSDRIWACALDGTRQNSWGFRGVRFDPFGGTLSPNNK